jgi:hypothetical protein
MKPIKTESREPLLTKIDALDAQWDDTSVPLYHALCRVVFFKHFRNTLRFVGSDIFEDLAQEGLAKIYSMLKQGYYNPAYKLSTFLYTGVRYAMTNFLKAHYEHHAVSYEELLDSSIAEIQSDHCVQSDIELLPLKEASIESLQYDLGEMTLPTRCKVLSYFITPKKMLNLTQVGPTTTKFMSLIVSDRSRFKLAHILEQNGQGDLLLAMLFLFPGEKIQLPTLADIKTIQMQAEMYRLYKKGVSIQELVTRFSSRTKEVTRLIAYMIDLEHRAALGEIGEGFPQKRTERGLNSFSGGEHPDLPPTTQEAKREPISVGSDESWTEVDYPSPDFPSDTPAEPVTEPAVGPSDDPDGSWTEVDYPFAASDLPPVPMFDLCRAEPVVTKVISYKETTRGGSVALDRAPLSDHPPVPRSSAFFATIPVFTPSPKGIRHDHA